MRARYRNVEFDFLVALLLKIRRYLPNIDAEGTASFFPMNQIVFINTNIKSGELLASVVPYNRILCWLIER